MSNKTESPKGQPTLKTNRPKKYMPMRDIMGDIGSMEQSTGRRKVVFKLRSIDIGYLCVFVKFENGVLYYEKLNDYLHKREKIKLHKVSVHRIISLRAL